MSFIQFEYCPKCRSAMKQEEGEYNQCTSQDCNFNQFMNPTPVVAAVVEYDDSQVVLAHNVQWPPGWMGLITGFVEKHENPDETVLREVKEELGLDAEMGSFIGHYTFKRMNQLIIAYHVKATGVITLNDELDEYKLVPFDSVKYWPAGTGFALRDYLITRGYSPEERPFK